MTSLRFLLFNVLVLLAQVGVGISFFQLYNYKLVVYMDKKDLKKMILSFQTIISSFWPCDRDVHVCTSIRTWNFGYKLVRDI